MDIKINQVLEIEHKDKGTKTVIVTDDFNTDTAEVWPLMLLTTDPFSDIRPEIWYILDGEHYPCKGDLITSFKVLREPRKEVE